MLLVSTVSGDVSLPDLGYTIPHPVIDFDIVARFGQALCDNSSDLTNAIQTGLLTYKKSSGGITELATDYSPDSKPDVTVGTVVDPDIQSIEFAGPSVKGEDTGAGKVKISYFGNYQQSFFYSGTNVTSRYLVSSGTTAPASNTAPEPMPFSGRLIGLTYSNSSSTSRVAVGIYKNGSLVYTWNITVNSLARRLSALSTSTGIGAITCVPGDRISVYLTVNATTNYPKVNLIWAITNITDEEGA